MFGHAPESAEESKPADDISTESRSQKNDMEEIGGLS